MDELTVTERNELREIFNLADKDGNGSISKYEIWELMDTLGIESSADQIALMISETTQTNKETIDFNDFIHVISRKTRTTYKPDEIKQAFQELTTHNAPVGCVSAKNLQDNLAAYNTSKMTREEIHQLISQFEVDSQGHIHYAEYIDKLLAEDDRKNS